MMNLSSEERRIIRDWHSTLFEGSKVNRTHIELLHKLLNSEESLRKNFEEILTMSKRSGKVGDMLGACYEISRRSVSADSCVIVEGQISKSR